MIIAGAGGAAHLPGMTSSKTLLPVLGVPVESKTLQGLDSLLSRSPRCRPGFPSERSRSAGRVRSTRRFSPPRSSRAATPVFVSG